MSLNLGLENMVTQAYRAFASARLEVQQPTWRQLKAPVLGYEQPVVEPVG